jgi:adenine-specific DNA-methyltransferase
MAKQKKAETYRISKRKAGASAPPADVQAYPHPDAQALVRPEVGAQPLFKKVRETAAYRYDSSLAPELQWDEKNQAREQGEALLKVIGDQLSVIGEKTAETKAVAKARQAVEELRRMSKPFLNWAGKAEKGSLQAPTLPLFIHERLSTQAIIETLKEHKKDLQEDFLSGLFGSSQRDVADQITQAYEYPDQWVNRMILGDSLHVMNSLLRYESMGGQVQCIYIDPPYGVKFGSNFQPFVRKRDVSHNDDDDLTREPEMVQAYRDTWELGLHSYLSYLRDRLLVARDLLTPSGSVFVQISDENLHHVREVMDEVFGAENAIAVITFKKTTGQTTKFLTGSCDYLVWYARQADRMKYREVFKPRTVGGEGAEAYASVMLPDGSTRPISDEERQDSALLPKGARVFRYQILQSQREGRPSGPGSAMFFEMEFGGRKFVPSGNRGWTTTREGMERLRLEKRLGIQGNSLSYIRYLDDFPAVPLNNLWEDTQSGSAMDKIYVVQSNVKVIQRCLLMTTDPGDLVLDPTCGSGTTAYVAEQWGRRWITIDTSRVPLALARQRLLTATFPYYELKETGRGPAGGFVYKRKQNQKGEEVGGIVPHVTLKSIANDEPPQEEVLVDRPEVLSKITRVTGPFTVEATIPAAVNPDELLPKPTSDDLRGYAERMLEILRRAPVLRLTGNKTVTLKNVRAPAKTISLSAEALVSSSPDTRHPTPETSPVAIVFGPESGPITERLAREAWDEAQLKRYTHLYVIGFAIEPKAREFVAKCEKLGMSATYLQATMDLQMGDLLKNMRSSQIFSVCGLPDVRVRPAPAEKGKRKGGLWEVELVGLDTYDPVTMRPNHLKGDNVPAWFLDTDYNGLCFHVCQAFFPRTSAWEGLKKALKADFDVSVWDHLSGAVSAPFEPGAQKQIAVKVIDDRGNELMVVKKAG